MSQPVDMISIPINAVEIIDISSNVVETPKITMQFIIQSMHDNRYIDDIKSTRQIKDDELSIITDDNIVTFCQHGMVNILKRYLNSHVISIDLFHYICRMNGLSTKVLRLLVQHIHPDMTCVKNICTYSHGENKLPLINIILGCDGMYINDICLALCDCHVKDIDFIRDKYVEHLKKNTTVNYVDNSFDIAFHDICMEGDLKKLKKYVSDTSYTPTADCFKVAHNYKKSIVDFLTRVYLLLKIDFYLCIHCIFKWLSS